MERVLVTGGTGFIGSHTIVELHNKGYEVDVVDNLCNSKAEILDGVEKITGKKPELFKVDIRDKEALEKIFSERRYGLVIHFAGLKAVPESIEKPLEYYENNISGTINLLECMKEHGVHKIIFSSSATVYGTQEKSKLDETMVTGQGITNPYGETKYMIEEILKDVADSDPEFSCTILRYFNPIGNHESGIIGEDPNGIPLNLMPIIMKVAKGKIPQLQICGTDYPTPDGTGIRDYIHVVDLAKGHIAAAEHMKPGASIYNLGTGRGTSVREMVTAFEKASGKALPCVEAPRRPGDIAEVYADPSKAERELNWKTELTIDDAMRDTLKFLSSHEA
ncbi:MAG: UDP-glucose 4-epimerase GalE [Candidatus Saccharibacteria bacterium]|nr:UDP-glucose 4-epimerase GalE [Candidatus Saccharibacteria bacterium]